eukprot:3949562-Ditylum_brightwellii.AAC.1
MHNWLNTGEQTQKFYVDTIADCPICPAKDKTWRHLFQCGHNDTITVQSLAVKKFKTDLTKLNMCPIIKQVLIYKVAQWYKLPLNGAPLVPGNAAELALHQAIDKQHKIGWVNFIKGRVSK